MITEALLFLIYTFVITITSPFRLLADISLSTGMGSAINTAGFYLSPLDVIIPVGALVSVLGIFLLFEAGYGIYKVTMWVVRRIPTQS